MLVKELINNLSVLNLANTAMSYEGDGDIRDSDMDKLLVAINRGLTTLYTRFINAHGSVVIAPNKDRTLYKISKEFAQSNPSSVDPYILDAGNPFTDTVINILSVEKTDNKGFLKLNYVNSDTRVSVFPPNTVEIINPKINDTYLVHYQASHYKITRDSLEEELQLPDYLVEPLTLYVEYLIYSSMNSEDFSTRGQLALARFDVMIMDLERSGFLMRNTMNGISTFNEKGFV